MSERKLGLSRRRACGAHRAIVCALLATSYAPQAAAFLPLITDDTGTQGSGGYQIELALNRQEFKSGGVATTTSSFPVVFTRGMNETLDLYGSVSYNRISSSSAGNEARGHGNPVLGAKWRFYEDEPRKLSVGFKPEIQFGTSADYEVHGLGNGRNGYSALLIATAETVFGAVHANYGYARSNYALESNRLEHRRSLHRLSVAPVFEAAAGWKVGVDVGLMTNPQRNERARMGYAELGAIWSSGRDLDIALGAIAFLGDGEQRSSVLTAGLTWRFR